MEMQKVPGWELKILVQDGYGYDNKAYEKIKRAVARFKKTMEQTATQKLKELQAGDFAQFIENMWNEAKQIATTIVMTWRERAVEYGYYDEETETVLMKDFILDACNFYVDNRDRIILLEEEMLDTRAAAQVFADMARPNILRINALRIYTQFCAHAMALAAAGIPVPDSIIQDVRKTVDSAILTAALPPERLNELGIIGR